MAQWLSAVGPRTGQRVRRFGEEPDEIVEVRPSLRSEGRGRTEIARAEQLPGRGGPGLSQSCHPW
ncbi:MAG: hypothetical protein M0R80_22430 [Proteobacteria bacterium]|nr:hypothetical protein [Pseudomonadota bacterium]